MKFLFFALLLFLGFGFFAYSTLIQKPQPTSLVAPVSSGVAITPKEDISVGKSQKVLFVPYWGMQKGTIDSEHYDTLIYFGISPNEKGIDTNEPGYKNIQQFINKTNAGKQRLLAIRMLDADINTKVLDDKRAQREVVEQTIAIAKQYEFNGIVLDLEYPALAFDSVIASITNFTGEFYKGAKANNLYFATTIYGDTFYRGRPYDVPAIAKNADEVMVMTYDFHKAGGNPGPNFPLYGKEIYGYDLTKLVDDFLKVVPKEKVTIVFGLFGYDWEVNKENDTTKNGEPLSYLEMKQKFIDACRFKKCVVKRDEKAGENEVRYTDDLGNAHIAWFEDWESIAKKQEYLEGKGINALGFWANSYF